MESRRVVALLAIVAALMLLQSCATTQRVPTLEFTQYGFDPGPKQVQAKADIDVSLTPIRISELYQYPELFSFDFTEMPEHALNNAMPLMYETGPLGKRWECPFATPDGSQQLFLCKASVKNGTGHILRMGDARVYMIVEGQEPMPAYDSLDDLLSRADYFEGMNNRELARRGGMVTLQIPTGFYRSLVLLHKDSYKLINDLDAEILPGFTYDGLLAFPAVPTTYASAKISFFDVTTRTDAAGNPVEKTQLDFTLVPQKVQMWYDRQEKMWKVGAPPAQP